ncbi:MAG TPA: DUF6089 family protein [Ferruginibacter sp.]|nr:DUF6089 family protein [Ferruginibacter sp.]
MRMRSLVILFITAMALNASAQRNERYEYVQKGEFGITVGAAHYFGDLNTRAAINRPKPAIGAFFRKQFGNYVGMRISAHYAQLGYSDTYSKSDYQKLRNLSFNSNIWEVAVQGDFNFFKFIPNDPDYMFTPYVTLGVGVFTYDPYAFLNGKKEFLRPLGTEGQVNAYNGRKQYSTLGIAIPLGVGIKYNISERMNLSFEVTHRFTNTDYLDDVSTTYAGSNQPGFRDGSGNLTTAGLLQDRSYEIDPDNVLGVQGRQRGWSKQRDQYIIAEIGLSLNISSYRCPAAN